MGAALVKFTIKLSQLGILLSTIFCTSSWHIGMQLPPMLPLPHRTVDALSGTGFLTATQHLSLEEREDAIVREILAGNVPSFLRRYKEITTQMIAPDGQAVTVTYHALPDYLAIGSDQDFVRIPMNLVSALKIASALQATLPTATMVDQIYRHADYALKPHPLPPTMEMVRNSYYAWHESVVEDERRDAGVSTGEILAGHKKDVVLSRRLWEKKNKIAIYGWHRLNGKPIQPLSIVHRVGYADYSHGIRLIDRTIDIDGQTYDINAALTDESLSYLLNQEGPMEGLDNFIADTIQPLRNSYAVMAH